MANQMIALQARSPQLPDPAKATAQYASMMNMAQQNETAKRQAAQAQQAMDINAAQEARAVDLQGPNLKKAGYEALTAQMKMLSDFSKLSIEGLRQAQGPEDAIKIGDYIKSNFDDPRLQAEVDRTVAKLTANPANFEPARQQLLFQSMESDKQLEQQIADLTTGAETYQVSSPKYAGAPGGMKATEIPGTRVTAPQGITYVKGDDGSVYAMPTKTGAGFGTPAPAVGTQPSMGAPGQGNTADVVYGFGEYGLPDKPLSTMRMGDVQKYQLKLIDKTRGDVGQGPRIGTGAVGTYQFTHGTLKEMAPKVFGANWRDIPFTADNQEKLAKALYEERKGGDLKKTWAGLPSNRPGQYANVPWEQVRDKIIQVESGGGNRQTPTGGASAAAAAPGGPTKILPGKPVAGALTPEKKLARDTAVQDLLNAVEAANKKGHLVSNKQSYIANRATELRRGRPYAPGGTAQKTSLDNIDATATQLLRLFIEKGTSGTLNTKVEQENFLKGVGGGDSTYETRVETIRNFAKQNGIPLNEGGAPKTKAAPPKVATPTTKAPAGVSAAEWNAMTPAERKLWQ